MIKLLATDLDRTLLPNGDQPYDGSMSLFSDIVKENKMTLAFVSGRHLALVREAMEEYKTPEPDYVISDVGTTLYKRVDGDFARDESWDAFIKKNTENWDTSNFKEKIKEEDSLRLQEEEKQNIFKLSYYIDDLEKSEKIVKNVEDVIKSICECEDALIVYSVDETAGQGLLDILPKVATKQMAIEYLREKLNITKDEVLYAGDSGNDILPLTQGYFAVMVRNTIKTVQDTVLEIAQKKGIEERICTAKGGKDLNGYYVSGIIEALIKFGFVSEK